MMQPLHLLFTALVVWPFLGFGLSQRQHAAHNHHQIAPAAPWAGLFSVRRR